jgi:hypothetical protein
MAVENGSAVLPRQRQKLMTSNASRSIAMVKQVLAQ